VSQFTGFVDDRVRSSIGGRERGLVFPEEEEMVAMLDPPRSTNHHLPRSAHNGEFSELLTLALLGLAPSLLAIGQACWLGPSNMQ
jgi:hypothetical protein